jgi:hypothetical protein
MSGTLSSHKKRQRTDNHVSTLAGVARLMGYRDGEGTVALFKLPWGIAVDGDGTSFWLTGTTIVSARSHHRAMCPLWRALA